MEAFADEAEAGEECASDAVPRVGVSEYARGWLAEEYCESLPERAILAADALWFVTVFLRLEQENPKIYTSPKTNRIKTHG